MSDKQGRARVGQGGQTFSVTSRYLLAAPIRNRAGQGRACHYLPGRYLLATPIRNRAGQGRAWQLFSLQNILKKLESF